MENRNNNLNEDLTATKSRNALTDAVRQRICEAVRFGVSDRFAARYAGVRHRWLRRWIKTGRQPVGPLDEPYQRQCLLLYEDIEKARGEYVVNTLYKIEKAGVKDWKALAWKLKQCLMEYSFSEKPKKTLNKEQKRKKQENRHHEDKFDAI